MIDDNEALRKILSGIRKILEPPENITISQWAEKYRRLSAESSSSAGRIKISNAEYQREMLDVFNIPAVRKVIYMTSSQVGKSTCIENVHGYYMHQKPCPMLNVNATGQMAEEFSKSRISAMCRDTPVLNVLLNAESRSKSTIMKMVFPNGSLSYAIASSPASLASRPIKILSLDEVDRYEVTKEGDAVQIAEKRTMTFWDSKILLASTPAMEGDSVIESQFMKSDARYYMIPCKDCEHYQRLIWKNVKWDKLDDGSVDYDSVHYECEACCYKMTDIDRYKAIKKGRWEATRPFKDVVGFHLSELYSPWRSMDQIVQSFIECKDSSELLQVWTNTCLGETWKEDGETVNPGSLLSRNDEYVVEDYILPSDKIVSITIGVDVQKDYIQYEVVGWGDNDESWSLEIGELTGDTELQETFYLLDSIRDQRWKHPSKGRIIIPKMCFLDSGYNTTTVYEYASKHGGSTLRPVKGRAGKYPIVDKLDKHLRRKQHTNRKLVILGVDTGKRTIFSQLKFEKDQSGYCHFGSHNDSEFMDQLTGEELRIKYKKGFKVFEWFKTRPRNEALDCRTYAYAAHKWKPTNYENEYKRLTEASLQDRPVKKNNNPSRRVRLSL